GSTANVPVNTAVVAPSPELAAGGRPPSPATAGEGRGEGPRRASAAPSPPTVEPFDAGALGAKVARRAAGRALSGPTPLWLSLLLCLAVLYLLLR
ncbi:MAG TPA: hypothetical protein VIR81_08720, partial [Myxococcales bacterium]